ncbi:MAG: hypothetical protein CMN60_20120 [Sphingobium sp.]|nr:hypothetical protein [Sphingobium sp.]
MLCFRVQVSKCTGAAMETKNTFEVCNNQSQYMIVKIYAALTYAECPRLFEKLTNTNRGTYIYEPGVAYFLSGIIYTIHQRIVKATASRC